MTEAIALDPIFETDFVKEMARQMRALDTYGTYAGWTVEKILDPYILTKERKANIPMIGDPDDETISRVKAFYNAIAVLIEKECELLAVPLVHHCRQARRCRKDPARRASLWLPEPVQDEG